MDIEWRPFKTKQLRNSSYMLVVSVYYNTPEGDMKLNFANVNNNSGGMVAQNTEEPEGTSGGKMMNFGPKAYENDEKR